MNQRCDVCGSETKSVGFDLLTSVSSDARNINHPISHSFCGKCGYIFIDEKNRVDYHRFYTDDYDFLLDGDIEPTTGEKKYSEYLVDFCSQYLAGLEGGKFFDIGCGKGNFIHAVYDRFPDLQFSALEPSRSYEVLKMKGFISELHREFFKAENHNTKYDFLSLVGVLEHVPNPKLFLIDIKRVMHTSSHLLIEVPNFENNKADLLTIDHLSKFTVKSIKNLFAVVGLQVVEERVSSTVPMQFIVKMSGQGQLQETFVDSNIENSVTYLTKVFDDANRAKDHDLAIYGQGLVMEFLIGTGVLSVEKISCVIDDNILYQGKKWKEVLPIVNFDLFEKKHQTENIMLAMNDCYHEQVLARLSAYKVLGVVV